MTNWPPPPVALAWERPGQQGPGGREEGRQSSHPSGWRLSHASEPQALRTWICQPEPSLALQHLIDLSLFYVSI